MRNWEDVLPKHIAKAQHSWERRMRIVRAINAGAKVKEIAIATGLSLGRLYQIIKIANRQTRYENKSPAEQYLNEFPWFDDTQSQYVIFERKHKFVQSTEIGRHAIKRAAKKFMMGKAI